MAEKVLSNGLSIQGMENGFQIVRLHYTADPDKTPEWAETMRKGYVSDIWNQEMELDFTKATGKRVYPEFKSELHISSLKPITHRDIWRGWDFGYHHPACVWGQVDTNDRLNIFCELLGNETVINKFADEVLAISDKLFFGFNFLDAGDPAVKQKTDKNERTTADILRQKGINIQSRNTQVKDGINIIRNLLLPRPDGFVKFKVDECCKLLVDGFLGGYVRKEDGEDEPEKDGYYEHLFDALRYMIVVLYNPKTYNSFTPSHIFFRKRKTANAITGY